jgi:hypothetical protein
MPETDPARSVNDRPPGDRVRQHNFAPAMSLRGRAQRAMKELHRLVVCPLAPVIQFEKRT